MSGGRVVIHDVDKLESFMGSLQAKREELETLYDALRSETEDQGYNWQDPQYEHLKGLVEEYCRDGISKLQELDDSIAYIAGLTAKLKDL